MSHVLVKSFLGWGVADRKELNLEPCIAQEPGDMNRSKRNHQPGGWEQSTKLRHDMANVLSVLQLRLYMVKKTNVLDDQEAIVFDQCLTQLRALLDCWKRLEAEDIIG